MTKMRRPKRSSHRVAQAPLIGHLRERGSARFWLLIAVIVAVCAGVLVFGIMPRLEARDALKKETQGLNVAPVSVIKPKARDGAQELVLPGSIQAFTEAPIYARTNGYLKRWYADIGTHVKAGQLLAEIDTPEVDQQLRQAEADVATAEANARIARITADRWRDLLKSDSVSKQDADEKQSQAASMEATLKSAAANRDRLHELHSFKRIVAPFDGVVTARETDIGQLINAGSGTGPELFRVADNHRLRLYVRVPQTYAAMMRPDLMASVVFPDRPGMQYDARLARTADALDATSRTLLAELIVDNKSGELLPGAYAEVHFKVPADAGLTTFRLPSNTLLFRGDGLHVATVDASGHVALKAVEIGRDYGAAVEIVRGITGAERVILSPPDSITEGTAVRVVAAGSGSARS